jgi:hypothetical protein
MIDQLQESIGIQNSSFTFSDVTSLWKLGQEAWAYISYESSKRNQNRVIKNDNLELMNGHLYDVNHEIYAFWKGYLVLVLDRFLKRKL